MEFIETERQSHELTYTRLEALAPGESFDLECADREEWERVYTALYAFAKRHLAAHGLQMRTKTSKTAQDGVLATITVIETEG